MRPNSLRAKFAIVSLYAIIAACVLYLATIGAEIFIVNNSILGGLRMNVSLYGLVIIIARAVYSILYIVCAIAFILWLIRAYRNLQILLPKSKFHYKPWAAVACWFIPVWNLFGPYTIASNLFDKTERYLVNEERIELRPKYDIVKGWWWALWIMSSVVIRVSQHYTTRNPFLNLGRYANLIGFILSILCAFYAIKMIRNYRELELLILSADGNQVDYKLLNDDLLDSGT